MKMQILFFSIVLLAGCSSTPISTDSAENVPKERIYKDAPTAFKSNSGVIIVKRDPGLRGALCSDQVLLNGRPVADILPSEKIVLYVERGKHIISRRPNGICIGGLTEVAAIVENGTQAVIRIGYGAEGDVWINETAF